MSRDKALMYHLFSGTVVAKSGLMILVSRAAGIRKNMICMPVCLAFCFACDGGFFFVDDDCLLMIKVCWVSDLFLLSPLLLTSFFLWDRGIVVVDWVRNLRHLWPIIDDFGGELDAMVDYGLLIISIEL